MVPQVLKLLAAEPACELRLMGVRMANLRSTNRTKGKATLEEYLTTVPLLVAPLARKLSALAPCRRSFSASGYPWHSTPVSN
jgi:hypothetical protein